MDETMKGVRNEESVAMSRAERFKKLSLMIDV